MKEYRKIKAHFDNDDWHFNTTDDLRYDFIDGKSGPYEFLLGALSGCFFSTVEDFIPEGVVYESADVTVKGRKRSTVPTTLEETIIEIEAKGVSDKKAFEQAVTKAKECCSIFQTIKCVSSMSVEIRYKD